MTFLYSEYFPFDENDQTEEVKELIRRRRTLVTKMMNYRVMEILGDHALPFNIPNTGNGEGGETRFTDHFHVITTNEGRDEATYEPFNKESRDGSANVNDLFLTVPFGFVADGESFLFALASKEVVLIPFRDPKLRDGTAHVICCVIPWNKFLRCAPGQFFERSGLSADGKTMKRAKQSDYFARAKDFVNKKGKGWCTC